MTDPYGNPYDNDPPRAPDHSLPDTGQPPQPADVPPQVSPGEPQSDYPAPPDVQAGSPEADPYAGYYQSAYGWPPTTDGQKLRQSGLGIASLVLGIVAVLIGVASFVVIVAHVVENPDVEAREEPALVAMGCTLFTGGLVAVVGLTLGIVALCQANRRKGLSVAGTIVSGCVVLGVLACAAGHWDHDMTRRLPLSGVA